MAIAFTNDPTKMRVDNMRMTLNAVSMGLMEGGIEVSGQSGVTELRADQTGITPLDTRNNGSRVTVKCAFLETNTLAKLKSVLHDGTLRSSGGTAVGVGGILSGVRVGLTDAVAMILHPLDIDDGTLTNDINVWKCVALGDITIKYIGSAKTVYEQTFLALLDTSKTAGKQLIDFGLAAAT